MRFAQQLFLILTITLCAIAPAHAGERTVYLVNVGWHVGIAIPVDGTLRRALPEAAAFPDAAFLEIGWGDETFYRAKEPSTFMALKAPLSPTPAVVHLYALDRPVKAAFERSEVLAFTLDDSRFAALFGYIHASFQRDVAGHGQPTGPGIYGASSSRFYKATGEFHLLRTCNTWVAEALAAAGLDIDPDGIITADGLMAEARTALARR